MTPTEFNRELFIEGYIDAMLWANTEGQNAQTHEFVSVDMMQGTDTSLLSEEDQEAELTETAKETIRTDCEAFLSHFVMVDEGTTVEQLVASMPYYTSNRAHYAGHDFALTRNHHGTGFWDRGNGEDGDALTEIAEAFGESNLYVNSGEIYHS